MDLHNQTTLHNQIKPNVLALIDAMNLRLETYEALPREIQMAWAINQDDKIMQLAYDCWDCFNKFFKVFAGHDTQE